LFTIVVYHSFAHANRLGPWLVFHKADGRVELPREPATFARNEIVHIQYITTRHLGWGVGERFSELNLVTCQNGTRKGWPLLQSTFTTGAFGGVLRSLTENTDLPVVRVKDRWFGWQTTEQPYGRPADS